MKKKKGKNKKECQKIHAAKRFAERCNEILTKEKVDSLLRAIHRNKSTVVFVQSDRVKIHKIEIDDKVYYVVYDKNRNTIVTFLTKEMVDVILEKEKQFNDKLEFLSKEEYKKLKEQDNWSIK